jgi:hypothetical protein
MIVFAIVWFSRILLTRQQLLSAARYGTDLIVYTSLSEDEVRQEIRNYLSHRWIEGRKLDAELLTDNRIKVKIDKFELPQFTMADYLVPTGFALRMESVMNILAFPQNHTSSVEIYYEFPMPALFHLFTRRTIHISARSEVIAGTGCPADIHKTNTNAIERRR